jgi:enoyl-CoA hydratase/carnithine racemase
LLFPSGIRNERRTAMEYTSILIRIDGAVGIITLNRPKALNALNSELLSELCDVL